jgi:hypothetical protein
MKSRYWVITLALVAALSAALPAVGAPSPSDVATKAMRLAKQADKRSRLALRQSSKRGPTGPAGAAGPKGTNGSNGANGSDGTNGSQGSTGATGPTGTAGTARAYAQVDSQSSTYVAGRTKGFTGLVVRPPGAGGIGVFCLTIDPALGIDPQTVAAIASPEATSNDHGGSAEVRGDASGSCSAGQFAVHTYDTAGVVSNTVSFMILVP